MCGDVGGGLCCRFGGRVHIHDPLLVAQLIVIIFAEFETVVVRIERLMVGVAATAAHHLASAGLDRGLLPAARPLIGNRQVFLVHETDLLRMLDRVVWLLARLSQFLLTFRLLILIRYMIG